ncbi:MAG TPA: phosphatase PAP2 family protein, partial [Pyrodictium sp.]|nr:phosphatase PAP2 family protein [Pyrodictium sp.]
NPFAAMPSMHVCMATIFAYYYRQMNGRIASGIAWITLMAFSTLYTANHYLVDVVAGSILGLVSCYVGWRLAKPSSRSSQ